MFKLSMRVRDYECDLQGVVNNSVYFNYLEHARHEFLLANNINFADLAAQGIDLMLSRVEIDYKAPLKPQDNFDVTVAVELEGRLKVTFKQDIIREDGTLIVSSRNTGLTVKNGKPVRLIESLKALADV